jgi:hypothetical protein
MYKCMVTGKMSRQGDPRTGEFIHIGEEGAKASYESKGSEKLNRLVVKTRVREYRNFDQESEEEWFSYGTEIVKEIHATDEGVAVWNSLSPEEQEMFVKGLP